METLAFYCRELYTLCLGLLARPWAEIAFLFAVAQTAMVVFLPWLCVVTMLRLTWIRRETREIAVRLDRVQDNLFELRKVAEQLSRSMAGGDTTVRFGPEGGSRISGSTRMVEEDAAASGQGRGSYDFCNGCKVIRYIKFSRCQTCGYHVS